MSDHKSSSAVRNLRSIFEHKASNTSTPGSRGSSTSSKFDSNKENQRPRSKIRTSFVPVELVKRMASTNDLRQAAANADVATDGESQKTAAAETQPTSSSGEGLNETAGLTSIPSEREIPAASAGGDKASAPSKAQVGKAVPSRPRQSSINNAIKRNPRPSGVNTTFANKTSSELRSPSSTTKSSTNLISPTSTAKSTSTAKFGRSSLTAPTAASLARAAAAVDRPEANNDVPKPKQKECGRVQELSSRLTAPTAASRARQGAATSDKPSSSRTSLSASQTSNKPSSAGRRSLAPQPGASGGFLERMTRPTAASQQRAQPRTENKTTANAKSVQDIDPRPEQTVRQSVAGAENLDSATVPEPAQGLAQTIDGNAEQDAVKSPPQNGEPQASDVETGGDAAQIEPIVLAEPAPEIVPELKSEVVPETASVPRDAPATEPAPEDQKEVLVSGTKTADAPAASETEAGPVEDEVVLPILESNSMEKPETSDDVAQPTSHVEEATPTLTTATTVDKESEPVTSNGTTEVEGKKRKKKNNKKKKSQSENVEQNDEAKNTIEEVEL